MVWQNLGNIALSLAFDTVDETKINCPPSPACGRQGGAFSPSYTLV